MHPGSAAPTRTGMASSGNICPRAPTSPNTARTTSTQSPHDSTLDPERHSESEHQPKHSTNSSRPLLESAVQNSTTFAGGFVTSVPHPDPQGSDGLEAEPTGRAEPSTRLVA